MDLFDFKYNVNSQYGEDGILKKILIYCGINNLLNFNRLRPDFKVCYGFDANPIKVEHAKQVYKNDPNVHFIFGALTEKSGEEIEFNITNEWDPSSTIGDLNPEYIHMRSGKLTSQTKIKVPTINLHDFCTSNNIKEIDMLLTDLQGMDLSVLKTMKNFIINRKIREIQCETETDNTPSIHLNLPSNKLKDFKLLLSADYDFIGQHPEVVPDDWWEMDTRWKVKQDSLHVQKQLSINIVYEHLQREQVHSRHRGGVSVIWTSLPLEGFDVYAYLNSSSYRGKQCGLLDVLMMLEPIVVLPGEYNEVIFSHFDHIFTLFDYLLNYSPKFIKILFPRSDWIRQVAVTEEIQERVKKYPLERKACAICMINGHKKSAVPSELYSKRIEAAKWFHENSDIPFDVYGTPPFPLPNFKGSLAPDAKLDVLCRYKYCLCFENTDHPKFSAGYITEKILDCFETRTIPIYLGSVNIEKYIPQECFIDFRKFADYSDLNHFLHSLSDEEYGNYIKNIDSWVACGGLRPYSWHTIYNQLAEGYAAGTGLNINDLFSPESNWAEGISPSCDLKKYIPVTSSPLWTWNDLVRGTSQLLTDADGSGTEWNNDYILHFQNIKSEDGSLRIEFLKDISNVFGLDTFIETGTYLGDTSYAASKIFQSVHTVELSAELYKKATGRFKNNTNIHVYNGDSGKIFPELFRKIKGKALFWLDGHYSEGATAKGDENTPIISEIKAIKESTFTDAIILIDDLRLFDTVWDVIPEKSLVRGYPSIISLCDAIHEIDKAYKFAVIGDIFMAYPASAAFDITPVVTSCTISRLYDGTSFDLEQVMEAEAVIGKAQSAELYALQKLFATCVSVESYGLGKHYRLWHALILAFHEDYMKACKEFLMAMNLGFDHWRINWYLAKAAYMAGYYTLASQQLASVLMAAPDYNEAQQLLKQIEASKKSGNEENKFSSQDRIELAQHYQSAAKYDKAINELEAGSPGDPDNSDIRYEYAKLYVATKQYEKAITEFRKILDINSTHAPAHNDLGEIYTMMGDSKKAMAHFKQAVSIDNKHYTALANILNLLIKDGNFEEAANVIKPLQEKTPNDVNLIKIAAQLAAIAKGKMESAPLVSIMIISYNGIDKIKACIESIKRNTPESHEIVIVDNAKNDGSLDYVKTVPGAVVIANPTNIGYSPARAQAMSMVKGKYIVSLDDDTIVTKGWVSKFIKHAENHPEVGIIGPRSNFVSGPQIVQNASYHNIVELETFSEAWSSQNSDHVTQAIRLVGFCMFIVRKVIDKIGCIDPNFGKLFGFDDDDYSLRAQVAGFKLLIADDIFIHHTGGPQGRGDKVYNELMFGAWEMFKKKWGIKKNLPYGSPYDIAEILSRKFDKSKHYSPLYERSILEKYVSMSILTHDDNRELSLAKLAATPLTAHEITVLGAIEPIGGWFTTAEVLSLHRLIKLLPNSAKILEIGSYRGRSTNAIGHAMVGTGMELYCLDVWRDFMKQGIRQLDATAGLLPPTDFAIFEDFLRNVEQFGDKIRILRGSTAQLVDILPAQFFDLIFVDGAHDYENVRRDITAALKCIKPDGIICGHDYQAGMVDVIRAVHELVFSSNTPVEHGVIGGTSIWFARYGILESVHPAQIVTNKIDDDCRNSNIAMKFDPILPRFKEEKAVSGMTSIIILTQNRLDQTKKCVKSIRKHTPEPHEIIFVDIGSTDGTVKWLQGQVKENKNCRLIENKEKVGLAKGCNQGINLSQGEFILLMDNDVLVINGWLSGMLECLNHAPAAGIVGPMTNNINGLQQVIDELYQSVDYLDKYATQFKERFHRRRIPCRNIVGFCMLFKRTLTEKIGLLDERFGAGQFEDEDFCIRASLEDYRNYIAGDVFVHHHGGKVSPGDRKNLEEKWVLNIQSSLGKKLAVLKTTELADDLYQKGKVDQAAEVLINCIKLTPDAKEIYYELARMFIESKRFAEALEVVESMPESAREELKGLECAGYAKEGLGLDDAAAGYAERMLTPTITPTPTLPREGGGSIGGTSVGEYPPALNLKGILAYKKGEKEKAADYFKKAIDADPGYGEAYTNLGVLYWSMDKKDEALAHLRKGFVLSPTVPDTSSLYYSVVSSLGTHRDAEDVFREVRGLYPNHKNIAFLYIDALIQQDKFIVAMTEVEDAIAAFGLDEGILAAALSVREKLGPRVPGKKGSKKATLSVCMIVKNEEEHLVNCLKSVRDVVDEMIVVDTGSTDKTKDIARVFGSKVFDFPWTGDFSEARNHSLAQATCDWILVLDADEVISSLDHKRLLKTIDRGKQRPVAFEIDTRNYLAKSGAAGWTENDGTYPQEEKGIGWAGSNKVRLFRNSSLVRFENPVHELLEASLHRAGIPIEKCTIPIHHYGRLNQANILAKGRDYFLLGRKKLEERGGGDYVALRELAVQAGELGMSNEAVDLWQQALALRPDDANALFNLSYHYMQIGKYQEALQAAKRSVELSPGVRDAVLNYALSEMFLGNVLKTTALIEECVSSGNENITLQAVLGVSYCIGGYTDKGLAILKELARRRINNVPYYVNSLAAQLIASGQIEYARLLIDAALSGNIADRETLRLRDDALPHSRSSA